VLIFFGTNAALILSAIIILYAGWEWANLAGYDSNYEKLLFTVAVSVTMIFFNFLMDIHNSAPINLDMGTLIFHCLVPWWVLAIYWIRSYPKGSIFWKSKFAKSLIGLLVLTPTWLSIIILISFEYGKYLIFGVIFIVALSDITAFFVGIRFGKHKLCKNVSPNKTWEGFLGAIAANLILIIFLGLLLEINRINLLPLFFLIMATTLSSVIGDLLISMLKRHRGIKDSGYILPGHGGVLDRIDGHSIAFPVFTLIFISSNFQFSILN
jgi:phosphatidate cytidylyltransferase